MYEYKYSLRKEMVLMNRPLLEKRQTLLKQQIADCLDLLIGTWHRPGSGAWPNERGIERHPVPEGFLPQLVYPFLRAKPGTDSSARSDIASLAANRANRTKCQTTQRLD